MFEDFEQQNAAAAGRGRMGVSLAISAVIFAVAMAGVAAAIATAHAVVTAHERDVDVEFAMLEAPEPVMQEQAAIADPTERPAARRQSLQPPRAIPRGRPPEAEGELSEATDTGPIDGFVDGGEETGEAATRPEPTPMVVEEEPPPPEPGQERDTITRPQFLSGCRAPAIPDALHGQAATIRVEVRMLVGPDGHVMRAEMIESSSLVPDELILTCAREQVFEPAHLSDGTAVPYPFRRRFVFRPASA